MVKLITKGRMYYGCFTGEDYDQFGRRPFKVGHINVANYEDIIKEDSVKFKKLKKFLKAYHASIDDLDQPWDLIRQSGDMNRWALIKLFIAVYHLDKKKLILWDNGLSHYNKTGFIRARAKDPEITYILWTYLDYTMTGQPMDGITIIDLSSRADGWIPQQN